MDTEAMIEDATALPPEAEARMQALLAEQQERRRVEDDRRRAARALVLAHHWPDEYHRCVHVRGRHLCRRCLALYPLAFAVMALGVAGFALWPASLNPWIVWLLCVPATIEFVAEKLVNLRYRPWRQTLVTLLVAPALGHGLAVELDDRWSWTFWGPVLVFGTIWFIAAVHRMQRTMFEEALTAVRATAEAEAEH